VAALDRPIAGRDLAHLGLALAEEWLDSSPFYCCLVGRAAAPTRALCLRAGREVARGGKHTERQSKGAFHWARIGRSSHTVRCDCMRIVCTLRTVSAVRSLQTAGAKLQTALHTVIPIAYSGPHCIPMPLGHLTHTGNRYLSVCVPLCGLQNQHAPRGDTRVTPMGPLERPDETDGECVWPALSPHTLRLATKLFIYLSIYVCPFICP